MRAVYRDHLLPSAARAETAKVTELYSTREIAAAADVPVEPESRRRGGDCPSPTRPPERSPVAAPVVPDTGDAKEVVGVVDAPPQSAPPSPSPGGGDIGSGLGSGIGEGDGPFRPGSGIDPPSS